MRRVVFGTSLVAACLVVAALALPAGPASAAPAGAVESPGAVEASCQVTMMFPGSGSASCGAGLPTEGLAFGTFVGGPICLPCGFSVDIANYDNGCLPRASGTADGTLHIGPIDHSFAWQQVGVVLVITADGNVPPADNSLAGVAAFVPVILPGTTPVPTCANPSVLTAHVAGVVVHI